MEERMKDKTTMSEPINELTGGCGRRYGRYTIAEFPFEEDLLCGSPGQGLCPDCAELYKAFVRAYDAWTGDMSFTDSSFNDMCEAWQAIEENFWLI